MNASEWVILAVEDEPDSQEVVVGLLDHIGIEVRIVGSAEEAISELSHNDYQAIILDLALPHMDGLTLLGIVQGNPTTAHIPCIVITAYDLSLVKKQALAAGCDAYLVKPLRERYLVDELRRVLTNRRAAE